jgi:hypothetical protein
MGFAALIPTLAPLILDALDGWFASGKITQEQYDEAKRLYTEAQSRTDQAVSDFKDWLNSEEE